MQEGFNSHLQGCEYIKLVYVKFQWWNPTRWLSFSNKEKAYFDENQIISECIFHLTEMVKKPQLLIWCTNQEITIAQEINIAVYYL